jgi:hypothetical protein
MHDCACHASFKLKHGAINVNAVNSAAESARTDGQTARRSALQPVPLQRCRHTVMTGVGPFNVTKLQQCLQFPGRVQAPLGMSDLRQRRDRGKATAMPSVRSSHRSGFLLSSPTVGTRLEIEGTEGSIVGINRSRNGASATTSPSELEWVEIADRR